MQLWGAGSNCAAVLRKLDGQGEAHLIAMAISQPPEGRVSWTMQMLATDWWSGRLWTASARRRCAGL